MGLTIGELKQKQAELTKRLNLFTRQGNYLMMMKTKAEITSVNDLIIEYERSQDIGLDDIQNKHLKSWFGKSISLSINCNDLSIYYLDSTINFLRTKGLVPKGSFETAANEYRKAANNLRKEIAKFLVEYEDDNWDDFADLEQMITDKKFTDREKVFKKQYEK
jgi:hypothetical protein